jgi:hypothetical protein
MALVFFYCGSDWKTEPAFVKWAHSLPEGRAHDVFVWLSENLLIFSNAGEGLIQQVKHNVRGHATYLLGRSWPRACWYYFWVLPAIKLSLPLLLLPILAAILRPRTLLNWAFVPAATLLLLSPFFRVQLGIRLILPLVVLITIGTSGALVAAWRESTSTWRKNVLAGLAAACVLWTATSTMRIWPHALCYTNELWGGPEQGYRYVSDTDYDWGQGLKELAHWQQEQGLSFLEVWYFGTDPAVQAPPFRLLPLHQLPINGPDDVRAAVEGRYLAVSATLLYGGYVRHQKTCFPTLTFLDSQQPVARTATFFIYDLEKTENAKHAQASALDLGNQAR